jgi:transposase-like protein
MSTYTIQPQLSPEIAERYEAILQALSGATTVTAAAEKLGLSRVQTHTLLNRAAAGVLESLLPKKSGRRAMPERERKLQQEVERLRKENARLQDRVETIDRLMGVASGILRGQVRTRAPKTRKKQEEGGGNEPEDPDGEARRKLESAERGGAGRCERGDRKALEPPAAGESARLLPPGPEDRLRTLRREDARGGTAGA